MATPLIVSKLIMEQSGADTLILKSDPANGYDFGVWNDTKGVYRFFIDEEGRLCVGNNAPRGIFTVTESKENNTFYSGTFINDSDTGNGVQIMAGYGPTGVCLDIRDAKDVRQASVYADGRAEFFGKLTSPALQLTGGSPLKGKALISTDSFGNSAWSSAIVIDVDGTTLSYVDDELHVNSDHIDHDVLLNRKDAEHLVPDDISLKAVKGPLDDINDPDALTYIAVKNAVYGSVGIQDPMPTFTISGYNITISGCTVNIHDNDDNAGKILEYEVAEATLTTLTDSSGYIVVDYNGGTPRYWYTTDDSSINESDVLPVSSLYNEAGDIIYNIEWRNLGEGLPNKLHQRQIFTDQMKHQYGLTLSAGLSSFNISGGVIWNGAVRLSLNNVNSALNTFIRYKATPTTYTKSAITTYNNSHYNPTSGGLTDLNPGKFTVNWVYRSLEADGHMSIFLGDAEYDSLELAKLSEERSDRHPVTKSNTVLVGRILVENGSTNPETESAFLTRFVSSSVTNHDDLAGIKGTGTHHLSETEHGHIANWDTAFSHSEIDSGNPHGVTVSGIGAEPTITTKHTAFNKNFGTSTGEVSEGNHGHLAADITESQTREFITSTNRILIGDTATKLAELIDDTAVAQTDKAYSAYKVNSLITTAKNTIIGGASAAYDTLKEIEEKIKANITAINSNTAKTSDLAYLNKENHFIKTQLIESETTTALDIRSTGETFVEFSTTAGVKTNSISVVHGVNDHYLKLSSSKDGTFTDQLKVYKDYVEASSLKTDIANAADGKVLTSDANGVGTWKTSGADLSNYLAKNNTATFYPSTSFNPATKSYVDSSIVAYNRAGNSVGFGNLESFLHPVINVQPNLDILLSTLGTTVTLSGFRDGQTGNIIVEQPSTGTGASLTIIPTPKVIGGGNGVLSLSTANGAIDILSYWYDRGILYITYGLNYN